jgi:ATPase complex subunit ATP10
LVRNLKRVLAEARKSKETPKSERIDSLVGAAATPQQVE